MKITEKFSFESLDNGLDKIKMSKHFSGTEKEIWASFNEVVKILFKEFNSNEPIKIGFNDSYIGFYRKNKNNTDSLFVTLRIYKNKLRASLIADEENRKIHKLKLSRKENRRDHGHLYFTTSSQFISIMYAIKYSYTQCILTS